MNNKKRELISWLGFGGMCILGFGIVFGIPIIEDTLFIGIAMAVAYGLTLAVHAHWRPQVALGRRRQFDERLSTALLLIWGWILVSQIAGTILIWPLKAEFRRVALTQPSFLRNDYGGALDSLVYQRKELLRKNGFVGIGWWETGSGGNHTPMLYIWLGPLRL